MEYQVILIFIRGLDFLRELPESDLMINWWKLISGILIAILLFLLGFFTYKWTHKPEVVTKIEYIKGDSATDSIKNPTPVKEYPPVDTMNVILDVLKSRKFSELFPEVKKDTILITKEDTSKILSDWSTLRVYSDTLINNDTLGFFKLDTRVQYNRLSNLNWTYTPIQKVITSERKLKHSYTPYFGAGIITTPSIIAQAGLFIDNWGFAGQYQYDWRLNSHNGGILIIYKINL